MGESIRRPFSRREMLKGAGVIGAGLAVGTPLLTACAPGGEDSGGDSSGGTTLKIGFVSPRTGSAAGFGEPDGFVLDLARQALTRGLTIGGTHYDVELIDKDSQSNPQRSSQVANDLINSSGVDLMLTTSTPETVNPVSDACEAAGVPCLSTVVPRAGYLRGAHPRCDHLLRHPEPVRRPRRLAPHRLGTRRHGLRVAHAPRPLEPSRRPAARPTAAAGIPPESSRQKAPAAPREQTRHWRAV